MSLFGGLLGIGSSIVGGNASRNASNEAIGWNNQALGNLNNTWNQTQQNYSPYIQGGTNAFNTLANMSNTGDMSKFFTSPGYQFQLGQGLKGIQNSAAGRGILNSPRTLQALNNYAQGQASNEYQNYFQNMFNLGQQGQQAAGQLGQLGLSQYTPQASGLYTNMGDLYGQKSLANGAQIQGVLGGISSLFGGGGGGGNLGSLASLFGG